MTDIPANANTTATVEDGVYRGQLETSGDVDWVAVELEAGETYTIRVLGVDSDNGSAQYLRILDVYDANSNAVDHTPEDYYTIRQAENYTTTEAQTEITAAVSGTYYIEINGWGNDTGSYTIYVTQDQIGGDSNDSLTGTVGEDSLQGGNGDDTLSGGAGNDYIDGEWGDDLLSGGDGADTFRFYVDDWAAILDREGDISLWGNDTIEDFDPTTDKIHFAGTVIKNLDDFTITESGGNTTLTTEWGDSVTLLNVSADELTDEAFKFRRGVRLFGANEDGTEGDDTITGDDDDNIYYGHGGDDVITGGGGHDYLRGFEGNDNISGGDGVDVIGGEDGDDTISGGADDDYIIAGKGNDKVTGDGGNDIIQTNDGDDTVSGGAGNDTLRPGTGDDKITGGNGQDVFVIGRDWGNDTITDFNINADMLDFQGSGLEAEDLTITSSGGNTVITSGSNSVTLTGVDAAAFEAAIDDLVLGAGSVTSHYTEANPVEEIAAPTDDILVATGIISDDNTRWEQDEDGITRVSFSFLNYDSVAVSDSNSVGWFHAIEAVTPYAQFLVEQEIARVETYTNLDMVWVEDGGESAGNIRMGYHEFVIGGASTTPYEGVYASDVFIGTMVGEDFIGGYFIHEMGHSLGFDDLPTWNEYTGQDYTIMSYVMSGRHEDAVYSTVETVTYQWADIAGLQHLYGVDTETTAGNDVFTFDLAAEDFIETIFDAGGIDTIQVTGTGDPVHIDLTPGSWSNIGKDITYSYWDGTDTQRITETGTLLIMPNTIIENAKGSSGDDTLTGNDASNTLIGFDGNDLVYGGLGNDTVWAGGGDTGNDTVYGGSGADILAGGAGDDLLVGNNGADIAFGGRGDDTLVGGDWNGGNVNVSDTGTSAMWAGDGNDLVRSASGHDQLGGGLGDDTIYGSGGNDVIYGGKSGADQLLGGTGNDILFGSGDNDIVKGGDGNDEIYGGADDDIVNGNEGTDTLYGGAGNDVLNGGEGDDLLYSGAGNDTLVFEGDHGSDTVTGFSLAEDELDLSGTITDFTAIGDVEAAASETTVGGASGLLIDTGDGNSIFLTDLTLADISSLQVTF